MASTSAGVPRPGRFLGRMGDAELVSIPRSEREAAVRTRLVEAVEGRTGKRRRTEEKKKRRVSSWARGRDTAWLVHQARTLRGRLRNECIRRKRPRRVRRGRGKLGGEPGAFATPRNFVDG